MSGLTAAESAEVDQWLAGADDLARAWPHNGHFYNDPTNALIFERLTEPWQTVEPGRSYLLWGNGVAVEVEPHPDVITAVARATRPRPESCCDRCGVQGVEGVALVAAPRHVVGLALCELCAAYLNPDRYMTIEGEPNEDE